MLDLHQGGKNDKINHNAIPFTQKIKLANNMALALKGDKFLGYVTLGINIFIF
jgi:hypothetical protein